MIKNKTVSQINDNGYHFPIDIMGPDEVAVIREEFDKLVTYLGGQPDPSKFKQLHLYYEWAYKLVTDSRILDVVEPLLGPNILVHSSSVFCKYPNHDGFIPWHQDGVYWGLNKPKLWSFWFAISDSNIKSGCMRVVPKSHKQKYLHFEQENEKVLLSSGLTISNDFSEGEIVNLELKAGQASLHHLNIAHSSENNNSHEPRIGFAIRYISTDVDQKLPHFETVLARGKDEFGHYSILSDLPGNDIQTSLSIQKESRANYLKKREAYLKSQV